MISPNIHTLQRKYTGNHAEFENPLQNPNLTKQIQRGSFKLWGFLHFFRFYKEHTCMFSKPGKLQISIFYKENRKIILKKTKGSLIT